MSVAGVWWSQDSYCREQAVGEAGIGFQSSPTRSVEGSETLDSWKCCLLTGHHNRSAARDSWPSLLEYNDVQAGTRPSYNKGISYSGIGVRCVAGHLQKALGATTDLVLQLTGVCIPKGKNAATRGRATSTRLCYIPLDRRVKPKWGPRVLWRGNGCSISHGCSNQLDSSSCWAWQAQWRVPGFQLLSFMAWRLDWLTSCGTTSCHRILVLIADCPSCVIADSSNRTSN